MKDRALIIEDVIKESRKYYKSKWGLRSFRAINNGYCMYFAEAIQFILESEHGISVEIVDSDTLKVNPEDGDNSPWNEKEFSKRNFKLHKKLSFEQLESTKFYYHVWVYDKETGKHYDSECPKGVSSVLSLPIYKRTVKTYESYKTLNETMDDLSDLFDELLCGKS